MNIDNLNPQSESNGGNVVNTNPSVVNNAQVAQAVPGPAINNQAVNNAQAAPSPVINNQTVNNSAPQNNLPPSPAPQIVPQNNQEVVVVDTNKKSTSNFILIILLLLLVVFIYFIDDIINFVEVNFLSSTPIEVVNPQHDNLVDGYIKIEDNSSYNVYEGIKFYNFTKSGNYNLLLNFTSKKNIDDVTSLGLYIEIYNSEKELLVKHIFDAEKVINSGVGSFIINLDEYSYDKAYYASIKKYTTEELNSTKTLTCTYSDSNSNYLLSYTNVFNFKNNELISYDVNKTIEILKDNKNSSSKVNEILKEKNIIDTYEIENTYENNILSYKVDLDTVNEGYITLYKKGTSPLLVNINETNKEWICK